MVVMSAARHRRTDLEPVVECPDRVGLPVVAASDTDKLTAAILVGLGSADGEEDAGRLGEEVFDRIRMTARSRTPIALSVLIHATIAAQKSSRPAAAIPTSGHVCGDHVSGTP